MAAPHAPIEVAAPPPPIELPKSSDGWRHRVRGLKKLVLGLVNQNQAGLHRAAAVLRSVLVHVRAMKALVDAMRLGRAEASLQFPLE